MPAAAATKQKPGAPGTETIDPDTGEVRTGADVTVHQDKSVQVAGDYDYDFGAGFEGQTSDDMSVPYLSVLQPTSPQVQGEDSPMKAGMFFNNTTGGFFSGKEGMTFIPAITRHHMVEWINRDKGGGFVGVHAMDSDLARRVMREQPLGKYTHPDVPDHDLIETYEVWGLQVLPDGSPAPAIFPMSSTFIKPFKDWMYMARTVMIALPGFSRLGNLPLFSHAYGLTTERQEKNGNTWFTPRVRFADPTGAPASRLKPSDDLYVMARGIQQAVTAGELKADTGSLRQEGVDAAPQKGDRGQEKAPY